MESQALRDRVRASVAANVPSLSPSSRVVIAVSGGGDSVATAALLRDAGIVDPSRTLVAHFDHRLRTQEAAARDRTAVDPLCRRYGFELITGVWEAPRPGEAHARDARYRFLAGVAHDHAATVVVTGHTADDQAETVLMRMMRGAGLHGLRGMAPEAPYPVGAASGLTLARPLLCATRAETRAYCRAAGLPFSDDETNADTSLLRNRVRLEIIPAMERGAPGARERLLAVADESRDAVAALDAIAGTALRASDDGHVHLDRAALRAMPRGVVPYAYRLAVTRLLGDARELDRRHYARLAAAAHGRTGAEIELPRGIVVTVDPSEVIVSVGRLVAPAIGPSIELPLPYSGDLGAWRVDVVRADAAALVRAAMPASRIPTSASVLQLPPTAVLRARRAGDRVPALHKKLQDAYVDAKVP
ncbi:MAG TPA: tRNA lysidine(34) synthetase TilS, partial [Dehalococcoidia bacterium]|nr:tRNA lysidine(34) synthetase TilS [Dehalococcoidia bacterium]